MVVVNTIFIILAKQELIWLEVTIIHFIKQLILGIICGSQSAIGKASLSDAGTSRSR